MHNTELFFFRQPLNSRDVDALKMKSQLGGFASYLYESVDSWLEAYARADLSHMSQMKSIFDESTRSDIHDLIVFGYNHAAEKLYRAGVALLFIGNNPRQIASWAKWEVPEFRVSGKLPGIQRI